MSADFNASHLDALGHSLGHMERIIFSLSVAPWMHTRLFKNQAHKTGGADELGAV